MLRKYEVMYILRHDAPPDVTQTAIEKIKDTITGEGGTILLHESWGKRKLAYEIERAGKGIYQLTTFAGQASSIKELERVFRIHPQVLRWLTVQLDDNLLDLDAEIAHYATVTPRMDPIETEGSRNREPESRSSDAPPEADAPTGDSHDDGDIVKPESETPPEKALDAPSEKVEDVTPQSDDETAPSAEVSDEPADAEPVEEVGENQASEASADESEEDK